MRSTGESFHTSKGCREHGIQANSYAPVVKTVRKEDGQQLTYYPKRLSGISA